VQVATEYQCDLIILGYDNRDWASTWIWPSQGVIPREARLHGQLPQRFLIASLGGLGCHILAWLSR
jgi:hypothetical protein